MPTPMPTLMLILMPTLMPTLMLTLMPTLILTCHGVVSNTTNKYVSVLDTVSLMYYQDKKINKNNDFIHFYSSEPPKTYRITSKIYIFRGASLWDVFLKTRCAR